MMSGGGAADSNDSNDNNNDDDGWVEGVSDFDDGDDGDLDDDHDHLLKKDSHGGVGDPDDLYAYFGVEKEASSDQIKKAFRKV
jgi:hypothetical protein